MFIQDMLPEPALNEVLMIRSLELLWFYRGLWRKYWFGQPDGYEQTEVGKIPVIDGRHLYWTDLSGNQHPFGWIRASWVYHREHIGVVPATVNMFVRRWFGTTLWGFGLAWYWLPKEIHESFVVGGRGSGKTVNIGLVGLTWAAIHPGEPWGHFALTENQANAPFNQVFLALGGVRHYLGTEENFSSFIDVFVDNHKLHPNTTITFRRWDAKDTGNSWTALTMGQKVKGSHARSLTFANVSLDESTKNVDEENVSTIASTARGANEYLLAALPPSVQAEIDKARNRYMLSQTALGADEVVKERAEAEYNDLLNQHGVNRLRRVYVMGNPSDAPWVVRRMQRRRSQVYVIRAAMSENPYLAPEEKESLERNYSTEEERRVELEGFLPRPEGAVFSEALVQLMNENWARHPATFTASPKDWQKHPDFSTLGPYFYMEKPDPAWRYFAGVDPGMGTIPDRNSFATVVFGVKGARVRVCGFRWGHVPGVDEKMAYGALLDTMSMWLQTFPRLRIAIDAGGQQEGLLHAAVFRNVEVYPVKFSENQKAATIDVFATVIAPLVELPPALKSMRYQLTQYVHRDHNLAQDIVMAMIYPTPFLYREIQGVEVNAQPVTNPYLKLSLMEVDRVRVSAEEKALNRIRRSTVPVEPVVQKA